MGPYAVSVLNPFNTLPIKAPYDFPTETSVMEYTHEVTLTATNASGAGCLPSGYGLCVNILPHAMDAMSGATGGLIN